MSPPMLYLHCGWPRTGTTSLQFALGESRAELREAGLAYPVEWERERFRGHHELVPVLESGKGGGPEEVAAALRGYDESVLFSTEGLTNLVCRSGRFGPLLDAVGRERQVTFLWTLRRVDEFFLSMHLHQGLSEGEIGSAEEFVLARGRSGWFERFVHGAGELERAGAGAVYTKYDPAGGHHEELLKAAGVPGPVRWSIGDRIRAGRRRSATVTHKTAVVLNHREQLSERAGVEIKLEAIRRLLRSGEPLFEDDREVAVADRELRRVLHEEALEVARRLGFDAYLRFFEDDRIDAPEPRGLEPEAIGDDDIERLVGLLDRSRAGPPLDLEPKTGQTRGAVDDGAGKWPFVIAHIPKTAGTSLLRALREQVPPAGLELDYGSHSSLTTPLARELLYYGEGPLSGPALDRRRRDVHQSGRRRRPSSGAGRALLVRRLSASGPSVIYGHFELASYVSTPRTGRLGAFVRDPVERVLSLFAFAREKGYYEGSLEDYLGNRLMDNAQSRLLAGLELSDLDFIGIAERFEESLAVLGRMLGVRLHPYLERRSGRASLAVSPAEREQIARLNEADLELYAKARELFERRLDQAVLS